MSQNWRLWNFKRQVIDIRSMPFVTLSKYTYWIRNQRPTECIWILDYCNCFGQTVTKGGFFSPPTCWESLQPPAHPSFFFQTKTHQLLFAGGDAGDSGISCYPSPVCVLDGKRGPPGAYYWSCQMIGTEWRSHGTLSTWSRLPQDVSGRWHGYPLLAWVSFLKERREGERVEQRLRGFQLGPGNTEGFAEEEEAAVEIQEVIRCLGPCKVHADQRLVIFFASVFVVIDCLFCAISFDPLFNSPIWCKRKPSTYRSYYFTSQETNEAECLWKR